MGWNEHEALRGIKTYATRQMGRENVHPRWNEHEALRGIKTKI